MQHHKQTKEDRVRDMTDEIMGKKKPMKKEIAMEDEEDLEKEEKPKKGKLFGSEPKEALHIIIAMGKGK